MNATNEMTQLTSAVRPSPRTMKADVTTGIVARMPGRECSLRALIEPTSGLSKLCISRLLCRPRPPTDSRDEPNTSWRPAVKSQQDWNAPLPRKTQAVYGTWDEPYLRWRHGQH